MFLMRLRLLFGVILVFGLSSNTVLPLHGDIVYNVSPVTLSSGFEIAGGTITTDGSVGAAFSSASIIDYEINITGPFDFTFLPTNLNARVLTVAPELIVTESEIYFPGLDPGESASFVFESRVQLDPLATTLTVQQVSWAQGSSPNQISRAAFVSVSFGPSGNQPHNAQGSNSQPMLDKFVVARINAVPEPSGLVFLGAIATCIVSRRRRRHLMT